MSEEEEEQEEGSEYKQMVLDILKQKQCKGVVLFAMVAGSKSFNLALPQSDTDYFAVYAGDISSLVSLKAPPEYIDHHQPDYVIYEVAYFCRLLLKGNPKLVEPLFVEHLCYQSPEWKELKKIRNSFITKNTIHQYVGYSMAQLGQAQRSSKQQQQQQQQQQHSQSQEEKQEKNQDDVKSRESKKYYHTIRLLLEAKRMIEGKEPTVWFNDDDPNRDYLMSIRRGVLPPEQLHLSVNQMKTDVHNALEADIGIPEQTDKQPLDKWLVSIRKNHFVPLENHQLQLTNAYPSLELLPASSLDLLKRAQQALVTHSQEGVILFSGFSGSCSHNLHSSESEVDIIAVYAAPTESIVSLNLPLPRISDDTSTDSSSNQRDTYARGFILMEVAVALNLILQGNHRFIELLYARPENSYETLFWRQLREVRKQFVQLPTFLHYLGVAKAERMRKSKDERLETKDKRRDAAIANRKPKLKAIVGKSLSEKKKEKELKHNPSKSLPQEEECDSQQQQQHTQTEVDNELVKKKSLSHALRLLKEAERIASGQDLKVWLDQDERDHLLSVRKGQVSLQEIELEIDRIETSLNRLNKDQLQLNKKNNKEVMNELLIQLRLSKFR